MKYTIEGLNQEVLVAYGLNGIDAIILRYIIDFWHTGKMAKIVHNEKEFIWINYQSVIDALPCIEIKNKISLSRRFKKYVDCGLMEHYTHKKGGTYSCYRFTQKYDLLIQKYEGVKLENKNPFDSKVRTKDSSINNSSINNSSIKLIYINLLKHWNSKNIIKHKETIFLKNIQKKHKDKIKLYGENTVKEAIDNYATVLNSDEYYWTHRWTLLDFLQRGLDKFVPEAKPLENFLRKGFNKKETGNKKRTKWQKQFDKYVDKLEE